MYRYSTGREAEGRVQERDIALAFSGAAEEEDHSLHPGGCRHQPHSLPISQCPETWSTRLVGGMQAVERQIEIIEDSVDALPPNLQIDMPGMHLGQHSLVLPCEICQKHSVVSWEWYREVMERSGGAPAMRSGGAPAVGWQMQVFQTPAEYYLFIAHTYHLFQTPQFKLLLQH